jgi:hypothetical protein
MSKTFAVSPGAFTAVMPDADEIRVKQNAGYVPEILYFYFFIDSSGGNILKHIHAAAGAEIQLGLNALRLRNIVQIVKNRN